jgi:predicted amidophosphoribosyltransferase
MARMICRECGVEVPRADWACPRCGKPGEEDPGQAGKDISPKGMLLLILLFVAFPVLLFLIHILVPGM